MLILAATEVIEVALDYMNDDHQEFVRILNLLDSQLAANALTAATATLDDIVHHTREHFAREESDMRRLRFPPYSIHKGEHDRLLDELDEVLAHWALEASPGALRRYLAERLAPWFLQHVATMDHVTARYVAMHREALSA
ncbi:MAG: bacteriohemerythrin [Thiotrichales bacterium]